MLCSQRVCCYYPDSVNKRPVENSKRIPTLQDPAVSNTLQGSDALIIVTEWNEFRHADFDYILHKLQKPVIFDGRNLYDPDKMKQKGFEYIGIGLSNVK